MTENNYKYNYILYNTKIDTIPNMFSELSQYDFVRVCNQGLISNNLFLEFIHKLHWSNKINRKLRLPFKKIWFRKMTDGKFLDSSKPTCYIFMGGQYLMQSPELADYIKSRNPENKIVIHFMDLLKSRVKYLDTFKKKSDLILTYDKNDAEAYELELYVSNIYSKLAESSQPDTFSNDLFFVGYSKGRLSFLVDIYDKLTQTGVNCCFWLAGVPNNERVSREGITYLEKPVSYEKVLKMVNKSRCVLEIAQPNSEGATLRTHESIVYKRKLLTNRKYLINTSAYNPAHMKIFDDINTFDVDFLKSPIPYDEIDSTNYCSPKTELDHIEQHFNTQET